VNKKAIIKRLLIDESLKTKTDYIKQYKMLAGLMKDFPDEDFWCALKLPEKIKSLYYLKTKRGMAELKKKYKSFHRRIRPPKTYNLGIKTGEDATITKTTKTVRDFLRE
jgi:hypothetical protein